MDGHWAAAVAAAAVATAYPAASLQACGVRVAVMNDLDMITGYDHTEGEGEITRRGSERSHGGRGVLGPIRVPWKAFRVRFFALQTI